MKRENTVQLSEVAEVISPSRREGAGLIFRTSKASYPLNPDSLPTGKATSYLLKTGDLVLQNMGNPEVYLVSDADLPDIYASTYDAVIKCTRISPEYLFMYLASEDGQKSLKSIQTGTAVKHIVLRDLRRLAVPIPDKTDDVYTAEFKERYLNK